MGSVKLRRLFSLPSLARLALQVANRLPPSRCSLHSGTWGSGQASVCMQAMHVGSRLPVSCS